MKWEKQSTAIIQKMAQVGEIKLIVRVFESADPDPLAFGADTFEWQLLQKEWKFLPRLVKCGEAKDISIAKSVATKILNKEVAKLLDKKFTTTW